MTGCCLALRNDPCFSRPLLRGENEARMDNGDRKRNEMNKKIPSESPDGIFLLL